MRRVLKGLLYFLGGLVALFLLMQLVPYGRDHTNPPVIKEPEWNSPRTRELAVKACFDCHSNETIWPWYSNVAPMSWLVQRDVDEGRSKLNFSEWDRPQKEAHEASEQLQKGKMPLWFYVPLHPQARLSAEEKQALIRGLQATNGAGEQIESGESTESDEGEHQGSENLP